MPMFVLSLLLVAVLAGTAGWWWGRAQCRRQHAALQPSLPELPNQPQVLQALTRTLSLADRLCRPVTVLMVEIDGFGALSAARGDAQALSIEDAVAERLARRVRTHDLLGHWGPGAFLVILPDSDVASALVLVDDMRQLVASTPLDTEDGPMTVTVSIGVHGRTPTDRTTLRDLAPDMVVGAQRALEATTADGPNRIEIEP